MGTRCVEKAVAVHAWRGMLRRRRSGRMPVAGGEARDLA
jgi:hypothetical protein